jgi:hypothetical protein
MRSIANRTLEQGAFGRDTTEKNAGKVPALPGKTSEHGKTVWRFYRQFMWQ